MDKSAYVTERCADGETEALIGWPMTDTDTKTEAPLRQFVNECRALGIVCRMARIDVRNAGAKGDLTGHQSKSLTQPHPVPKAGAIDAAEAFLFKRCASSSVALLRRPAQRQDSLPVADGIHTS